MHTLSLKLSDDLIKEIEISSKEKHITKSRLVREAIIQYLRRDSSKAKKGSFLELAKDLCGSFKGPKDLSSNKKYLEGFGE